MSEAVPGHNPDKTVVEDAREKFLKPKQPDDFDDVTSFLRYATKLFDDAWDYDQENRKEAVEDLRFLAGDQWDSAVLNARTSAKKPTLTINRLPAFVAQLVGARRVNSVAIKVVSDDNEHRNVATIRQGLIRSIQKQSRAQIAYNKAFENQVACGIGSFGLRLEYASDDVFEQDVCIYQIPNALAVVYDPFSVEPCAKDANYAFEVDTIPRNDFKQRYPNTKIAQDGFTHGSLGYDVGADWITRDEVRVVNFWRMRSRKRFVALMQAEDGTENVVDITDMEPEEFQEKLVTNSEGIPVIREVDRKYAQLYVITAADILEGPYDLPIDRVPLFRAEGWTIDIANKRSRFGAVRFMRDPQKLHNYWRSTIAEKLQRSPKQVWIATQQAIEGREDEWRNSHLSDSSLLVYDGEAGLPPQRVDPPVIETALLQEAGMAEQDLKDVSNLHEASLGLPSNEVSGKAVIARQRVGELGSVLYSDNMDLAIEECGRVINQLIPVVYDTPRLITILDEEDEEIVRTRINDDELSDITAGKYEISSVTGPSALTKRVEAREGMLNMVNAMPDVLGIAADKIVEAQEWPGAEEIAARIRTTLPEGLVAPEDMTPSQREAYQAAAQARQAEAQRLQQLQAAEMAEKVARTRESEARAVEAEARAAKYMHDMGIDIEELGIEKENSRVANYVKLMEVYDNVTTPK